MLLLKGDTWLTVPNLQKLNIPKHLTGGSYWCQLPVSSMGRVNNLSMTMKAARASVSTSAKARIHTSIRHKWNGNKDHYFTYQQRSDTE